jgi:ABC-type dipeptide/oligopeptide/nickel transport system permease subunit
MTGKEGNAAPWPRLCVAVIALYALTALLTTIGVAGSDWATISGGSYEAPSTTHMLGTNRNGQDVLARGLVATRTAFEIGLTVAVACVALSALLGAAAGFFAGSLLDEAVLWLAGVLDAVPFYLLVIAVAYAMGDHPLSMQIAMISTYWTTGARLVRGEALKLRQLEFVAAARATGAGAAQVLWRHVVPGTRHLLLMQATLSFVAAIKAEAILSFLGLGVNTGVSWGLMLSEAAGDVARGHYMNLLTATAMMFGLVLATSLLADGLQRSLDPKQA